MKGIVNTELDSFRGRVLNPPSMSTVTSVTGVVSPRYSSRTWINVIFVLFPVDNGSGTGNLTGKEGSTRQVGSS